MHAFTLHSSWLPDVRCSIPSRWDELSGQQLEQIARISLSPFQGANLAKLLFMVLISELPWWQRLRAQWFYLVSSSIDEKADLLFLVDSFQEEQTLTEQKIPEIRLKLKKYRYRFVLLLGPSSKLGNATFWEYVQAEKYYLNYLEAVKASQPSKGSLSQIDWLDKLVATLYREAKPGHDPMLDTDQRIPLTDAGFKWRLHLVERMPIERKLAILMWFESCRNLVIKSFPAIFQPPDTSAPKKKRHAPEKLSARERNGQHWLEMISELAGSMDRYAAIGQTHLWTAFTDISHKIRKNEEAKRQAQKVNSRR